MNDSFGAHEVATAGLGIVSGVVSWFVKIYRDDLKDMEREIRSIKDSLPDKYISRAHFDDKFDLLLELMRRVESKLDGKVDKS